MWAREPLGSLLIVYSLRTGEGRQGEGRGGRGGKGRGGAGGEQSSDRAGEQAGYCLGLLWHSALGAVTVGEHLDGFLHILSV